MLLLLLLLPVFTHHHRRRLGREGKVKKKKKRATWPQLKSCKFLEMGGIKSTPRSFLSLSAASSFLRADMSDRPRSAPGIVPLPYPTSPPAPQQCTSRGQHFQSRFDLQTERGQSYGGDGGWGGITKRKRERDDRANFAIPSLLQSCFGKGKIKLNSSFIKP